MNVFIRVLYHLTNSLSLGHIPSLVRTLLFQPIYVQDLILVWLLSDIRKWPPGRLKRHFTFHTHSLTRAHASARTPAGVFISDSAAGAAGCHKRAANGYVVTGKC